MRVFPKAMLLVLICAASAHGKVDAKIARTWKAKCASCHGVDGKGNTESGKKAKISDFTRKDWQKSKTDAQLKTAIEDGVKKDGAEMDPYKDKLEAAQIDGLVKYIRKLK
jgi:mono/diheme cytochrome c family protein